MTLRHLKIFVAVCEYGSTTKAAEALYIAQPTISYTIGELEKYYNVVLFERINQRLVLTEIGKEILAKAKEILTGFEDFESLARFGGTKTKVRMGASLTLGQTVIPNFCKSIEQKVPEAELQVTIAPYFGIRKDIESGNLDFAIIDEAVSSSNISAIPFRTDRLVVVASSEFDVPKKLSIEEIVKYPLLLSERGNASRDVIEKAVARKNLTMQPRIESVNNQAIITAIYASLGLSILPDSFVRGHIERGKLKEISLDELEADYAIYIVMHKNKKLNPIQQRVFDELKKA